MRHKTLTVVLVAGASLALSACFGGDVTLNGARNIDDVSLFSGEDANILAIGIYEHADGYGTNRSTPMPVTIAKAEGPPIKLALSAYEPIEWRIEGPGAGRVEAAYLDGYYTQSVSGIPLGTRTINKSGHAHRRRGSSSAGWGGRSRIEPNYAKVTNARNYGTDDGQAFVYNAETLLEGRVRSFTGTYYATGVTIDF